METDTFWSFPNTLKVTFFFYSTVKVNKIVKQCSIICRFDI